MGQISGGSDMPCRFYLLALILPLVFTPALAKDKKSSSLPVYVLRARTVRVAIDPQSGEPLDQPFANRMARENVEKALMEWGRFEIVPDGQESDLVIMVRTGNGKAVRPTIQGGPIDQRTGEAQGTDSSIRIGGQRGQPPPLSNPGTAQPDRGPHIGNEIGGGEDTFEVYRGDIEYPLDSSPVFRYIAKNCLKAPKVAAVEEFRKAIVEAEKPQIPTQKKP
jgi:hypothetical protein